LLRNRHVLFVLLALAFLSACASSTPSTSQATPTVTETPQTATTSQTTATAAPSTTASTPNSPLALANSYYRALEAHNYSAASTYLASNASIADGQQLTRDAFIQMARGRDQESGSITSFETLADTSDPSLIVMTISRSSEQAYHSHIQFKHEGNGWKIVSIDVI
jgi:ABC-type Fe3+-hydroxamate transport system substrate-binding protein